MWEPDKHDPLKIRRNMALMAALWALIIWPHELLLLNIWFDLSLDLIKALLLYITTLAGTSIGMYLFNCHKADVAERKKNVATVEDPQDVGP